MRPALPLRLSICLLFVATAACTPTDRQMAPAELPGPQLPAETRSEIAVVEQAPVVTPSDPSDPKPKATVTIQRLNLRSGASINDRIQAVLHKGDLLEVVRSEGKWVLVRTQAGREGWVFGQFITGFAHLSAAAKPAERPAAMPAGRIPPMEEQVGFQLAPPAVRETPLPPPAAGGTADAEVLTAP